MGIVYLQPNLSRATRLANDIKASMQGPVRIALRSAHAEMAERVQEYTAQELVKAKSARPQRAGRLLELAIQDPRNSEVGYNGFAVGLQDWLDASPARAYYRRIEEGGPNPMAALGRVQGLFRTPGFGSPPSSDLRGVHGRLGWIRAVRGGFEVAPTDVASGGYHMHRAAGIRFRASGLPYDYYARAFRGVGLDFLKLYRLGYGAGASKPGYLQSGSGGGFR